MSALVTLVGLIAYLLVFYWCFVIAMAAKAAWSRLPVVGKVALSPPALTGVVMDVVFNVVIFPVVAGIVTIILTRSLSTAWEIAVPHELMFTHRLDRYELGSGRLAAAAMKFCRLLNPFEVGGHCIK